MEDHWITSAGIDIGTSTTKMIVSRLKLSRTSSAISLPRFEIVERELLYASPIYSTPLKSGDEVDAERIGEMLKLEYGRAGVRPSELKSGAVIITGETANKKNASQILHLLAEQSGDFVVATAGADLEGLLAGRGAGAEQRSMQTRGAVANIDIGGGTANAAFFRRGKPVGTITFHVGGRLIQLDGGGAIAAVSPSIRPWLQASGYRLHVGQVVSYELLREICTRMSRDMLDYLAGGDAGCRLGALQELIVGDPLTSVPPIEEWMVSGGIGQLMEEAGPANLAATSIHGDIGPLLASMIKEAFSRYPIKLVQPDQTGRATVIGAGMQSTEISGATVHLDASLLPIRNLPVLKLQLTQAIVEDPIKLSDAMTSIMQTGASLYEHDASPPFALALSGVANVTYASLQSIADILSESFTRYFPGSLILVVICENDIAKALGQSLEKRCVGRPKVISIDQIKVEYGDYIDLGKPISGVMIPVVVKTLAFHNKSEGGKHR
ncbi:ethanolamine ammonia-lyase reactivating factor EutA [Paenibacillus sedimenti]|uniref:Ethanolamine ammonia-lyase reactivating factor EutA n=1 Tax=Paenibacillus sedimenti TaxID=2770274 RepID=A0A926QJ12_9BACL|nr:ethanolamine ammonia-lyase reactivating factor EutA [Paenibacillus sedimenti]MBD0380188.1 ethanolamine ammonia-lyase reactivating factor EutA [Paenibacillus sedimenti]